MNDQNNKNFSKPVIYYLTSLCGNDVVLPANLFSDSVKT